MGQGYIATTPHRAMGPTHQLDIATPGSFPPALIKLMAARNSSRDTDKQNLRDLCQDQNFVPIMNISQEEPLVEFVEGPMTSWSWETSTSVPAMILLLALCAVLLQVGLPVFPRVFTEYSSIRTELIFLQGSPAGVRSHSQKISSLGIPVQGHRHCAARIRQGEPQMFISA